MLTSWVGTKVICVEPPPKSITPTVVCSLPMVPTTAQALTFFLTSTEVLNGVFIRLFQCSCTGIQYVTKLKLPLKKFTVNQLNTPTSIKKNFTQSQSNKS